MSSRFSPQVRALDFLVRRPISHRGLHDKTSGIIENTASAFAAAIAGNYAIECDLRLTSDGEAIVFHDPRLDRLTEAQGWVRELTAGEMKQLAIRGSADHAQTLEQLLEQVDGRVPLVIELKSHWDCEDRLVTRTLDVLQDYRGAHCLMSFDPHVVEAIRVQSPETVRGIVADRAVSSWYSAFPIEQRLELRMLSHLPRTQPHFVSFHASDLPWPPVTGLREAGCPVISWTIRSPEQAAMARRYSDQITFEQFLA